MLYGKHTFACLCEEDLGLLATAVISRMEVSYYLQIKGRKEELEKIY